VPEVETRSDGRFIVPLVAVIAITVGLWAGRPYAVGVFHDDGVYAILAKALATGQGYRYLHLPEAPAATHYPPGYPLFLSLIWKIAPSFPGNIRLMVAANAVLLGVVAVGVMRFARPLLDWPIAACAIAALMATIAYPMLMLSSLVLSETLFAALLLPALILAERTTGGEDDPRRALAAGACAGVLIVVRTHGAAVLLALLLCLVLRRRLRSAVVAGVGATVMVAPWQLWSALHAHEVTGPLRGSYGSYIGWFVDGAREGGAALFQHTIATNARESLALLADRFSLGDSPGVRAVTEWLVLVTVMAGAWRLLRRTPVTVVFMALYMAVVLVWPFTPWRFVFAVWPIVVLSIGEAIVGFVRSAPRLDNTRRSSVVGRVIAVAVGLVIAAGAIREEGRAYRDRTWRQGGAVATAQIGPLVSWARSHTSPGDVIAAEGEQLLYLFAVRQAVPLTTFTAIEYMAPRSLVEDAAAIGELLDRYPIRYVATVSPLLRRAADSLSAGEVGVESRKPLVRLIAFPGGGAAYRVLGGDRERSYMAK
jgi:hypothetical protein